MVRTLWIAGFFVLSMLGACGGDITPKVLNEPCTRDDQCVEGLECLAGVCLVPDDEDDSADAAAANAD